MGTSTGSLPTESDDSLSPVEAFAALGNETRVALLRALGDAVIGQVWDLEETVDPFEARLTFTADGESITSTVDPCRTSPSSGGYLPVLRTVDQPPRHARNRG